MTPAARLHYIMITRLRPLHCVVFPLLPQVNSASDPRFFTLKGWLVLCLRREGWIIGRRGQMLVSDASNKCMNKLLDKWMAGLNSLEKTKDLNFYRAVVEEQEEKTL